VESIVLDAHAGVAPGREAGLEDETRQLALLIRSVNDYAIYMLDPEGYIRSWNPGGERIKGYAEAEIIGSHFSRFFTPEDVATRLPYRALDAAREKGKFEGEGWRVRKDGSRFWASVVIDPIWRDGELIGFAKVTRDITERHQAQLRLQETQAQLAHSQKMEAVGKLTLGLAHDFNNLLAVMVNCLELIDLRPGADARTHELVAVAQRAADRGTLLTRQLLSFGCGQPMSMQRHPLEALLQASMELYRRACGGRLSFHDELGRTGEIDVDCGQLEAAILNLIVNARDACQEGGAVRLRSSVWEGRSPYAPEDPARAYARIEVVDSGPGMEADVAARAFEPFFTTKTVGQGSGLGLSQVFGFAAQSGGFAIITSEPGQGCTVTLCLPLVREQAHVQ